MRKPLCILLACLTLYGYSADRYWIASSNANWNNTSNWSTESGGAGGASVPGSSDKAIFDGNGLGTCTIDIATTVDIMDVQSGFTDTIYQGTDNGFAMNSASTFAGGVFVGSNKNITAKRDITISGTKFTSTSAIFNVQHDLILSGSGQFIHNNGTVLHRSANGQYSNYITGVITFNILELSAFFSSSVLTISDTLIVEDSLIISGDQNKTWRIVGGVILAKEHVLCTFTSNPTGGHTTKLIFQGSGNQWVSGTQNEGCLPDITVRKNANDTLFIGSELCIRGDLLIDSGFVHADTSDVRIYGSSTINGDITFDKLKFISVWNSKQSVTLNTGTNLTVETALGLAGNRTNVLTGGTINAHGSVGCYSTNVTNTWDQGTTKIILNGSGNQTLHGVSHLGGSFPKIVIDKESNDTVFISDEPVINFRYTYLGGVVDTENGVLGLGRKARVDSSCTLGKVAFIPSNSDNTSRPIIYATSTLTVLDSMWVKANTVRSIAIQDGTIDLKGHLIIENAYDQTTYNDATIKFTGTQDQYIVGLSGNVWGVPFTVVNKDSGVVVIQNNFELEEDMTLTKGVVWCDTVTATAGKIIVLDNKKFLTPTDSSYVDGTVDKIGNETFVFPMGSNGNYQRIVMSPPSQTTDRFRCSYYVGTPPEYESARDSTIVYLSDCEYWDIERIVGSSSVDLTFPLDSGACRLTDSINDIVIAHWTGEYWENLGSDATTGTVDWGTVKITGVSSFTPFTFSLLSTPTDQTVLLKQLDGGYHVANGVLRFVYDEEYNDTDGELRYNVYDQYNTVVATQDDIPLSVSYGDNRLGLNIACIGLRLSKGYYILEVINEKNEKQYVRFYNPRNYLLCPGNIPVGPIGL